MTAPSKLHLFLLLLSLHLHPAWSQRRQEQCSTTPAGQVINHLSATLTNHIGGQDNLFFSPLSVSLGLGMVYLGSRGTTAQQAREVLGYGLMGDDGSGESEEVHLHFRSLMGGLEGGAGQYTLLMANGMFPQVGFEVRPEFGSKLAEYYAADSTSLDFAQDGAGATDALNNWVSNRTMGKIAKLFESPLDSETLLVLLNSVYFKGLWKVAFDERLTYDRDFHNADGSIKRTPFMEFKQKVYFYHHGDIAYSFLELKYRGDRISMLLALPDSSDQLPDLQMTSQLLCDLKSRLRKTTVEVYLPKFKMTYERELSEDMAQLGMSELFAKDRRANLSGIREQDDVYVSQFKHQAVIEVNEKGSEAAAATGVAFYARSGFRHQAFMANHPFGFWIVDWESGAILFSGRVMRL